jgi:hypothetical protein
MSAGCLDQFLVHNSIGGEYRRRYPILTAIPPSIFALLIQIEDTSRTAVILPTPNVAGDHHPTSRNARRISFGTRLMVRRLRRVLLSIL